MHNRHCPVATEQHRFRRLLFETLRFLVVVSALVAPTWGASQDDSNTNTGDLKRLTLEQLTQVQIVSVTKEAANAFQTPAAISVMTSADIRRTGATNIPDILRLIPGVEVSQIDGDKWAVGIRGFEGRLSKSMLVLIDGRSVYTPLFAGVYWEVQDTLIEDIDRIEVIRGPGGTIWGANAVNGVVNIITKSAKDTHGMLVSAGGGNVEQGFLNWRYGGGDDHLSYRVYGKGYTRGPQLHADGQNFDDGRMGQIGFRTDWSPGLKDDVTIQGDSYSAIDGQALGISTYSPPAMPIVQGNGYFAGQNLVAAWRHAYTSGSDIKVQAYFDRTDRQDLNYREIRNTVDVDFLHHIPFARHQLTWGAGARISPSHFFQTAETVDFEPHAQTYNIFSAFVQDGITLIPNRLEFTAGIKLEHNSFSGLEFQPSGRLAWTPNSQHTFWAAVTRAVRTPSRIEDGFQFTALAVPSLPLYVRLIGDGNFQPESMLSYELGYRNYFRKTAFVGLTLFHNRYDDLLSVENLPPAVETTPAPTHLVLPLFLRNGILANSTGGEVNTLWDVREGVRVRASYSFVAIDAIRSPASDDASTVGQLKGDTPQHKLVVQTQLSLPKKFEADLIYRFVSAIPDQKVGAYSTGDIRFGWRKGEFDISLVGRNLMQPSHVEYGGDPGPLVAIRRSGFIMLSWSSR